MYFSVVMLTHLDMRILHTPTRWPLQTASLGTWWTRSRIWMLEFRTFRSWYI